ncbi:hypothetical protein SAY87_029981 [Trapa incisa]|uniref:Uncharacterized protein n=1 Tax=Trapa incisa TaxID=236973 RepID=A0AAN7KE37_9MYRT|nr:hypothetical protein SAY87_029981 [Trapa incisa]
MPQSKLVKTVKRLKKKLWPPRKRTKRPPPSSIWANEPHPYFYLDPMPYNLRRCSCSAPSPTSYQYEPSAPPLPPWLESEQQILLQYAPSDTIVQEDSGSSRTLGTADSGSSRTLGTADSNQYQLHTAPEDPVYAAPEAVILPAPSDRRERSGRGGFLGCLSGLGINAIRCFFPCFHIKEACSADQVVKKQ